MLDSCVRTIVWKMPRQSNVRSGRLKRWSTFTPSRRGTRIAFADCTRVKLVNFDPDRRDLREAVVIVRRCLSLSAPLSLFFCSYARTKPFIHALIDQMKFLKVSQIKRVEAYKVIPYFERGCNSGLQNVV